MSIKADQLAFYVIVPTLKHLRANSQSAVTLLLATGAQESHEGSYLHQIHGPAIGIYEQEVKTHDSLWANFLVYKPALADLVKALTIPNWMPNAQEMAGNLYYATGMARVKYLDIKQPLPHYTDRNAVWAYYKRYWNTEGGAATKEEFMANCERFGVWSV